VYTNDALNRLSKADEGKMTGSAGSRLIASAKHTRIEEFTLEQTGNWANQKLDLNGDGDQADADEKNWNNTFNIANEKTAWGAYSPTFDEPGNMTDDGRDYKYIYDAFNRLVKVTTRGGSPVTVAEYKYNGLGYRIGWHYDVDVDADVDGSDPWYYFLYDERWRIVATFRGTDAKPKDQYVYHAAAHAAPTVSPSITIGPAGLQCTLPSTSVDSGPKLVGPWVYTCGCCRVWLPPGLIRDWCRGGFGRED